MTEQKRRCWKCGCTDTETHWHGGSDEDGNELLSWSVYCAKCGALVSED